MRVLICDQESEMLETVARWFEVDTATSKATCIDLMRANPFDVLIASERLSDGSGLELLSHVATRWPDTLRVLVIEPDRLRLLRGKLAPFRLHATMRYPIEEDELEAVLNRMGELLGAADAEEEPAPQPTLQATPLVPPHPTPPPAPPPAPRPGAPPPLRAALQPPQPALQSHSQPVPRLASRPLSPPPPKSTITVPKIVYNQDTVNSSSLNTRVSERALRVAPSSSSRPPSTPTSRVAKGAPPLGAPPPPTPAPVRRKLGNYTPLGSPDDDQLRIVQREFDRTAAPLAARALRMREEANRPRTGKEKLDTLTTHLRDTLKKLLKR
jgi:hypothetical protein